MIELMVLMAVGLGVVAVLGLALFLVKIVFKVVLIPVKLAFWLVSGLIGLVVCLPLLVLAVPLALVAAVVVIPVLAICAMCWAAFHVLAFVF